MDYSADSSRVTFNFCRLFRFRNKGHSADFISLTCGIQVSRTRVGLPGRSLEQRGEASCVSGILHERELTRQTTKMLIVLG